MTSKKDSRSEERKKKLCIRFGDDPFQKIFCSRLVLFLGRRMSASYPPFAYQSSLISKGRISLSNLDRCPFSISHLSLSKNSTGKAETTYHLVETGPWMKISTVPSPIWAPISTIVWAKPPIGLDVASRAHLGTSGEVDHLIVNRWLDGGGTGAVVGIVDGLLGQLDFSSVFLDGRGGRGTCGCGGEDH